MRIPTSPPTISEILARQADNEKESTDLILRLHLNHSDPAPGGRYRHWQKLQYLQPPEGLTPVTWWLAVKLARGSILKPWPLLDLKDQPFQFAMPDVLLEMVHRIDRQASGAIEAKNLLPTEREKRSFLIRSLTEEAINSSQLEGAATTRKVAKKMLREGSSPRNKSEQMILNNFRGMQFISETAKDRKLDPDLVFELHGILTEDTLEDPSAVGRFRRDADEIAILDETGKVLHDPPRAAELPDRLSAMCRFANDDTSDPFIHPVVRSILLHFWLAYDHPFVDGNGRTARALFYWSMARHGYWLIEFTSISRLLLRARGGYNRAFLYAETDANDATYFVLHQCQTILQAIDELHEYIGRKMADVNRSHELLRDSGAMDLGLNHRQLALVWHAADHPGMQYTVRSHRLYHNVSYQTARTDLLRAAELGLLHQSRRGKKEMVFLAPDDLHLRLEEQGKG